MIRPQAEIDEETQQSAFSEAVAQKNDEDDITPQYKEELSKPEEYDDIEVIEGEPDPEVEPDTGKSDSESNVLGRLVDLLEDRKAPVAVPEIRKRAVLPVVDREEVRKKFNDKLHETDDPFALVEESAQALMGGTLAQQSLEIQKLKKEALKSDPINKMVFDNWDGEVESAIADLPANQQIHPDAYEYAIKQVRDKHFMEILESKVDERISAKTRPGKTATLGATTPGGGTKRKTKKVYASPRDKSEAKRYGLSLENYLMSQGKI
jgi:hypothetical protein